MDLKSKSVAVVGYGVEGKSAAAYALSKGAQVTVCDSSQSLDTDGLPVQVGASYLDNISEFDVVFRSPSIKPSLLKEAKFITSNTNWFLENAPSLTVGVTGSKGKGTTSTLIHRLAGVLGIKSWLVGNIGKAALDVIDEVSSDNLVVLELSSFQLIDAHASPDVAVCLMIEPDHMNWHGDMDEYINAKSNITVHQGPENVFIHHPTNQNVQKIATQSKAQKFAFQRKPAAYVEGKHINFMGQKLLPVEEVGMMGRHNLDNICAALTAIEQLAKLKKFDLAPKLGGITEFIRDFKGLEHRLEFVRTVNGVNYYNDTFSTMPSAAIAGIAAFDQPIVAIVGGVDKGVGLNALAQAVSKTKQAILIGEIAEELASLLKNNGYTNYKIIRGSMVAIVDAASGVAGPGDVVLLSPGSSSFDMFENYMHRGKLFKKAVHEI